MGGRRLFALVFAIWAAGFLLTIIVLDTVERAVFADAEAWADEQIDEVLEEATRWLAYGHDQTAASEIPLASDDWASFSEFREDYREAVESALAAAEREGEPTTVRALLSARLVLIGTPGMSVREPVDVERVVQLMLEETPEELHDRLEGLIAAHWEDLPFAEAVPEPESVTTADIRGWLETLDDELEALDEFEACAALLGADGNTVVSNFVEIPPLHEPRLLAQRRPFDDGEAPINCLVAQRELADGGVLLLGVEAPAAAIALRDSGGLALLGFLILGVVSGALTWVTTRHSRGRLAAINAACERVRDGDYGHRIPISGDGPLDRVAADFNAVLEQTDAAMASLRTVSANIAHDLRTPLTRLRGQIDLLLRTPTPDESMISAVQAEADQLLDTFSALLRIAQVESGSPRRGFRDFDLRALLADAAELYQPAFEEQRLGFHARLPEGDCVVHGDLDLWMQSIANLMDNALKYVPAGETVTLSLTSTTQAYQIALRDTGRGIPELELSRVLDRFYRLPKHRGEKGNGLGLSLVAAVCELHGTKLALRNDAGLVVEITWPRT